MVCEVMQWILKDKLLLRDQGLVSDQASSPKALPNPKLFTHPATIETQCIEQTSKCLESTWPSLLALRFSKTTAT